LGTAQHEATGHCEKIQGVEIQLLTMPHDERSHIE